MSSPERLLQEEWAQRGAMLFGPELLDWRFECPVCGEVQTPREFQALGADPNEAHTTCIGQFEAERGCEYTNKEGLCVAPLYVRMRTPEGRREVPIFGFADSLQTEE